MKLFRELAIEDHLSTNKLLGCYLDMLFIYCKLFSNLY